MIEKKATGYCKWSLSVF